MDGITSFAGAESYPHYKGKSMPVIRFGKRIRLTGADAEQFLANTGRSSLPRTITEYNQALDEAVAGWLSIDSPEGNLLAHLIACDKLIDDESEGEVKRVDTASQKPDQPPPLPYLRDEITGQIKFTQFGLGQYAEDFEQAGINIADIKTETDFEATRLNSIKQTIVELMCKLVDYPDLDEALKPFANTFKAKLKGNPHAE